MVSIKELLAYIVSLGDAAYSHGSLSAVVRYPAIVRDDTYVELYHLPSASTLELRFPAPSCSFFSMLCLPLFWCCSPMHARLSFLRGPHGFQDLILFFARLSRQEMSYAERTRNN